MPAGGAVVKGAGALRRAGLGMIGGGSLRPHAPSTHLRLFRSCSARLGADDVNPSAPASLLPGLHIVATPIGNLQDLSPRALTVLKQCDKILCEDTRHTRHLCTNFGITTPLESLHEHNEAAKCQKVLNMLETGAALALVSDAGMPCVSDPGSRLVAAVAAAGLHVSVVPGPSAMVAAMAVSGFDTSKVYFAGFLPAKDTARRRELEQLRGIPGCLVLFVPPHAVHAVLQSAAEVLGGSRRCVLARELTKLHEEVLRGTLAELAARFEPQSGDCTPRGEFSMVVGPDQGPHPKSNPSTQALSAALQEAVDAGMSRSAAAAAIAAALGVSRKQCYQLSLELEPKARKD